LTDWKFEAVAYHDLCVRFTSPDIRERIVFLNIIIFVVERANTKALIFGMQNVCDAKIAHQQRVGRTVVAMKT
jgi:hypothetical protein